VPFRTITAAPSFLSPYEYVLPIPFVSAIQAFLLGQFYEQQAKLTGTLYFFLIVFRV
jgi:hypothetical protein